MDYLLQFQLGFSFLYYILNSLFILIFLRLFFQHHFAVQSLALILVLGVPSKQNVCKIFIPGLMLTSMRDILVN